jgi:hypothetical protein
MGLLQILSDILFSCAFGLVRLNQTLIVNFECKSSISDGQSHRKDHSPVEWSITTLCTIVDICLFDLVVEAARDVKIEHARKILFVFDDVTAVPHYYSDFVLRARWSADVELLNQKNSTL